MEIQWGFSEKLEDEASIEQVEAYFGVVFPERFKEIVRTYNYGGPKNTLVFMTSRDEERLFSFLLNFNLSGSETILKTYKMIKDRLPPDVYPFAGDPGGNYLCFDYSNGERPEIKFWDHEAMVEFEEGEVENGVVIDTMHSPDFDNAYDQHHLDWVASDFDEFLSVLFESAKDDSLPDFFEDEEEDLDEVDEEFWDKLIQEAQERQDKK